jgi:hypothetical protein
MGVDKEVIDPIKLSDQLTKEIGDLFANSMQYDPSLGRKFIPSGRVQEIKDNLHKLTENHLVAMMAEIKEALTKLKVQEMAADKHYFITVPKDCDPRDIEDLIKITDQIAKDWPSFNAIRLVLSRGVDMDETKNGAIISSMMELLRVELDDLILHSRADQISAIDTAMSEGGARTVVEIENKMAHQRGAYMHALDSVKLAFDRISKKLADKYYIVDKSDLKK